MVDVRMLENAATNSGITSYLNNCALLVSAIINTKIAVMRAQ